MRTESNQLRLWLTAAGLAGLSLIAAAADQLGMLGAIRPSLHDIISPGRLVLLALTASPKPDVNSGDLSEQPRTAESGENREALLRRLMIENARLRRDLQRDRVRFGVTEADSVRETMLRLDAIPAKVISSRDGMPAVLKELLVDVGRTQGITRSELVLQGSGSLVDVGTSGNVQPGDRVLDGLTVIGRIEKVARWVSLVQPVTASGFRSQVMLLRRTPEGYHLGAKGVLEGTGNRDVRLTGIAHTEPVAVGDDVVSVGVEGLNGPCLYFGEVTSANFTAGGQWEILVTPAVDPEETQDVQILRWELDSSEAEPHSASLSRRNSSADAEGFKARRMVAGDGP